MNQKKIGAFIAECRKERNLTQEQLAEKLGVTAKSISNWENGRNMPDLSLFKSLCDELSITINDLMSGEKIDQTRYQETFEENIVQTIDYSTKRFHWYRQAISLLLMVFGAFVAISAMVIFPSESSWGSIYSIFGLILFTIGIAQITDELKWQLRALLVGVVLVGAIGMLLVTDYLNVKWHDQAPRFRILTVSVNQTLYYDTLFYDVYRCNFDTEDEYWEIVPNGPYDVLTIMDHCRLPNKN